MAKKTVKKIDRGESRLYSYDEYQREFFPKPQPDDDAEEPEVFGVRLAEQVLKRITKENERPEE